MTNLAGTHAFRPLVLSLAEDPLNFAVEMLAALRNVYPGAVNVTSVHAIERHATQGAVVVVATSKCTLDCLVSSKSVQLPNVAILGWAPQLENADRKPNEICAFLDREGIPMSKDFAVDNDVDLTHFQGCTSSDHRHLSIGVVVEDGTRCLPAIEIANDSIAEPAMYFPGRPYFAAQLDAQSSRVAGEIAIALHSRFGTDYSRTDFTVQANILSVCTFDPYPRLSRGSLMAFASGLVGSQFEQFLVNRVVNAAGRLS